MKFLTLLFIVASFATKSFAQEEDRSFVIQVATYDSWEAMAKDEKKFYQPTGTADNNFFAEKVGNRIKVYLFDSYQGSWSSFYPGTHADNVLATVKENPNWKGAFRKKNVGNNLKYYGEVFNEYKNNELPEEYSSKGGSIASTPSTSSYRIQLGVFNEEKSVDHIAASYGLSETDKEKSSSLISHDFTTVKKEVCRRYYFGEFKNKADALKKKKALEKNTKRKLLVVKQ